MKIFLPLIILAVVVASCRSTRKISTAMNRKDSVSTILDPRHSDSAQKVNTAYSKIIKDQINFSTFQAKVKVDYDDGKSSYKDLNAVIRMKKDSVIWISVNALLGIEAMRVIITPDTVSIMNKLEKTIQYQSFDYLREVSKLPVDFATLQNLLLGNKVFLDSNIVAYGESESFVSLTMLGKYFKNFSQFAPADLTLMRSKLDDVDVTRSRSADLSYEDYVPMNGYKFANKRGISISDKKRLNIGLEFKQVQFDGELNYPFNVPANYKLK